MNKLFSPRKDILVYMIYNIYIIHWLYIYIYIINVSLLIIAIMHMYAYKHVLIFYRNNHMYLSSRMLMMSLHKYNNAHPPNI